MSCDTHQVSLASWPEGLVTQRSAGAGCLGRCHLMYYSIALISTEVLVFSPGVLVQDIIGIYHSSPRSFIARSDLAELRMRLLPQPAGAYRHCHFRWLTRLAS